MSVNANGLAPAVGIGVDAGAGAQQRPYVLSFTIGADGASFTAIMSEAVTLADPGGFLGWVIPGDIVATVTGGDGTDTLTGTLARVVDAGQAYGFEMADNAVAGNTSLVPVLADFAVAAIIDASLPDLVRGRRLSGPGVRRRTRR